MEFVDGEIELSKPARVHILDIVNDFAARAFRRPLVDGEAQAYAALAESMLDEGRPFLDGLRVALRAVLTSPSFLFHGGNGTTLDDYGIASRLSYFLWRSMPDDELFEVAAAGNLSDPEVLESQIERMLGDAKMQRFVDDFAAQAFRLSEINATTPDGGLYPEYDERLGQAMVAETRLFLQELIQEDLGVRNLIREQTTSGTLPAERHRRAEHAKGVAA